MRGVTPAASMASISAAMARVVGPVKALDAALALGLVDPALPGTTAPSDRRMMRVGSSMPRLGSISRRE